MKSRTAEGPSRKPSRVAAASSGNRPLGPRAVATKERLLEATVSLLESGGLLDFKVVDVARLIGSSPATFYQYFGSVEDAILMLCERANLDLQALYDVMDQPWTGRDSLDQARQFVRLYFEHFDGHRAVLRVRNLAAQEGDPRFRAIRNEGILPLTKSLETKIRESQSAGRVAVEINPFAAGGGLVAMMERLAAFRTEFALRGVDRDALIETTARMVHQTVTGRR